MRIAELLLTSLLVGLSILTLRKNIKEEVPNLLNLLLSSKTNKSI
ncbi:transposase, IS605 family [Microcystis aeruginosa FACHB-905 = DIANCHI905]|uniref:Uncharacterized protein n=1 Tax=Microcystis aeruginosa PCC 7806SL TaxID=1903187 RepID=A0AB33C1P7_MICA7|nr:hypothetical protein BH695_4161 [Microcystis aeruginosa PCC 7806SL]ELS48545.1 transposase, IS605 family [Microcystis aeruginosa FACHB-905 = DIANCHI905]